MYRKNDCISEFKNGNINIKFDQFTLEKASRDFFGVLADILDSLDCYFVGDFYCFGNDCGAIDIYNLHSDFIYRFTDRNEMNIKAGKSIKLYANIPDQDDRENINAYFGND